jgi:hypothetical protein
MKKSTFVRKAKRVTVSFGDAVDDDSDRRVVVSEASSSNATTTTTTATAAAARASSTASSRLGTKMSVRSGLFVTSTGLHDLDRIIGDGVALSSIVLLEEDESCSHYASLLKYFLAQGLYRYQPTTCHHQSCSVARHIVPSQ